MTVDPLGEAVDALTKIRIETIRTDNGPLTVTADPRLQQLREAIATTMIGGGGAGRTLASERSPLSSDALHRASIIQSQISEWCRAVRVRPTRDSITDLEAWYAANPDASEWHIAQLEKWAREIDDMLTPKQKWEITVPCPICGIKEWTNSDGERCTWPLKGQEDPPRVVCLACEAVWDGWAAAEELKEELDERHAAS